jgi:hypothetical protein
MIDLDFTLRHYDMRIDQIVIKGQSIGLRRLSVCHAEAHLKSRGTLAEGHESISKTQRNPTCATMADSQAYSDQWC